MNEATTTLTFAVCDPHVLHARGAEVELRFQLIELLSY